MWWWWAPAWPGCAQHDLVRRGITCAVLEARDRVGGRTLSTTLGRDTIDLGGQWIGPTQNRLAALAAELGIALPAVLHRAQTALLAR